VGETRVDGDAQETEEGEVQDGRADEASGGAAGGVEDAVELATDDVDGASDGRVEGQREAANEEQDEEGRRTLQVVVVRALGVAAEEEVGWV
jgi:hypothetical protein